MLDISTLPISSNAIIVVVLIALLPALLLAMTAFTRIYIVLAILRQALGIISAPSNQILLGVSLLMTCFVMQPVFDKVFMAGVQPYLSHKISLEQALERSKQPFTHFMKEQTRKKDLQLFQSLAKTEPSKKVSEPRFTVTMAAFMSSELRAAFRIGFMIYVPFLLVDLLVAAVLMSMGMIMVSPLAISLPLKLLLFILVDGWSVLLGSLIKSFVS
jgi:flagellar biosynthesis protein FliP